MAKVTRALALLALWGCNNVKGLGGPATPLGQIQVQVTGDVAPLRPAGDTEPLQLHVALVWGAEWLPEVLCILPPGTSTAAVALAAGCRDSFGFVPVLVAADAPVGADGRATLTLYALPSADVMVGDVTARVAYGSLVVYDDRDGTGNLELRRSFQDLVPGDDGGVPVNPGHPIDRIYGASFLSMTQPDQRIVFREGAFDDSSAFYPRAGCPPPPPGFSVASAGGFSSDAALTAALMGKLPAEDPATCALGTLAGTVITIPVRAPAEVQQVACSVGRNTTRLRYHEPGADPPDPSRKQACVPLPHLGEPDGGMQGPVTELVVAGAPGDACKSLTHYLLEGCEDNPTCASPSWDHTASPPAWWPCPSP